MATATAKNDLRRLKLEFEQIFIDGGTIVLCDVCCKDFSNLDTHGGFLLFGGWAVCPDCDQSFRKTKKNKIL